MVKHIATFNKFIKIKFVISKKYKEKLKQTKELMIEGIIRCLDYAFPN